MGEKIRAKVARILNSREIVITAGSQQGVVTGMLFDVMDPKGEDITDPDSGEVLGSLERPKVRVQVTQTQDRISVAATFKKQKVNVGGAATLFSDIGEISRAFMPPKYVVTYETLKTTEKTWEDLDEKESFVKSGDPVVQVIEEINLDASTENG